MKKLILFVLISSFLLSSCGARKEVNKLSLITGIGIEYTDDKTLKVIIQYLKPVMDMEPELVTKEVTGNSIYDAIKEFNEFMPRQPYWSHNFIILLSEDVAKEGVRGMLDFFRRNIEMRQDTVVIITKKPSEILYKMQEEDLSGFALKSVTRDSAKLNGTSELSTIHKVYQNLFFEVPNLNITHMSLDKDNPRVDGLSLFNEDKYVTTIKGDIVKGWAIFDLKKDWTSMVIDCPSSKGSNNKISYNISNHSLDSKVFLKGKDSKLNIVISGDFEAAISESQCMLDMKDPKTITKLEKNLNKVLTNKVKESITHSQDIGLDYFGFGNILYRAHPKDWKKIENNYIQKFKNAEIKLNLKTKIRSTGAVYD